MQRLLGWAARGTGDGASRSNESATPNADSSAGASAGSAVASAVAADTRGDYALAVDLYAAAIEKLLLELRRACACASTDSAFALVASTKH